MINRKLDIYEPDQIKAVFTFLKAEKTITDITEAGIYSTIYTDSLVLLNEVVPIYLKVGQIITIDKVNYPVITVDLKLKCFTIEKTNTGLGL